MQFGPRRPSWRALAACVAIHAVLLASARLATTVRQLPTSAPGTPLQVALIAAAPAPGAAPAASVTGAAPAPAPPEERAAVRYYFPEELERELILLRDPAADDSAAPPQPRILHLFVNPQGRVAAIRFEGEAPAKEEEAALRAAFMQLEFLPALRHGRPVPARIRIELLPDA